MANRVTLSPKWKSGTTANSITNTNSGNVGIGTTSPGNKLVVAGASTDTTTVHLDSGGHAYSQIDSGGNTYESLIRFMDGGSTRFTMGLDNDSAHTVFSIGDNALTNKWLNVTNTGNVGIGTAGPAMTAVYGKVLSLYASTTSAIELGANVSGAGALEGAISFNNGAASGWEVAKIQAVRGAQNDGNAPDNGSGDIAFSTKKKSSIAIQEVMRITNTGNVGIGTTSPKAVLHIKAGTATANTAPLKFTSGTVNTTAEAGTVEYDNTFHVTNSDATRRHVVTAPSTIKTTAGAPYTNDGYVVVNIGGTDFKVMTTA